MGFFFYTDPDEAKKKAEEIEKYGVKSISGTEEEGDEFVGGLLGFLAQKREEKREKKGWF